MDEKRKGWVGIPPSPKVFSELDSEETTVLAFLAWSVATRRPALAADVAELPDRDGRRLGMSDAQRIVERLNDFKIASVIGMRNPSPRPLSVFLGGFVPFEQRPPRFGGAPRPGTPPVRGDRRPGPTFSGPRSRPSPAMNPFRPVAHRTAAPDQLIENKAGGLPALKTTRLTPAFVPERAAQLRKAQAEVEAGSFGTDLIGAATERLRILRDRIALYKEWLEVEPNHPFLWKVLERKRKALPELEYQLERARVKQAELNAENAA